MNITKIIDDVVELAKLNGKDVSDENQQEFKCFMKKTLMRSMDIWENRKDARNHLGDSCADYINGGEFQDPKLIIKIFDDVKKRGYRYEYDTLKNIFFSYLKNIFLKRSVNKL